MNGVLAGGLIPTDSENVGLAAGLAVLDIALAGTCGGIDSGFVPLTAARTLVSGIHTILEMRQWR